MGDWRVILLGAVMCAACQAGRAPSGVKAVTAPVASGSASSSTPPTSPPPAQPANEDAECRSPEEPGCNPCWLPRPDGRCDYQAWRGGSAAELARWEQMSGRKIVPWYNAGGVQPTCPEHYKRCARCTERNEQEIRDLGERPECNCKIDPGEDPCEEIGSCGCYCEHVQVLSKACPEKFRELRAK